MRAIRILHDWEIGDKKLVVKVDAKTKEKLDEYKATKKASHSTKKAQDEENELDEATRDFDLSAKASIQYLLHEHSMELSRPLLDSGSNFEDRRAKRGLSAMEYFYETGSAQSNADKAKKMAKSQETMSKTVSDIDKDPKNVHTRISLGKTPKTKNFVFFIEFG